jgi:NitT/TauT family transport system substrate-binding protein
LNSIQGLIKEYIMPKLSSCLAAIVMLIGSIAGPAAASAAGQEVSYRLKWLINMSTVGDVYADVHGFFRAEGLKVEVKPGGVETDAIRELELGYADFGVASADQVIRALNKGAAVVVVAQLFQVNPLHWVYRPDRVAVDNVRDLAGKTVGVTFGKNDEIIMRTLLNRASLREDQVRLFSVRLDYTPFYNGAVDLWPVYINTQGVEIASKLGRAGEKVAFFNPAEHDVRFVANSVITSQRMLDERPQTVARFVRALTAAWDGALDPAHARKAMDAVRLFDQDTSEENMKAQLTSTRALVKPTPETRVGAIDRRAWQQTEEIMLAHDQINGPVHVVEHLWEPGTR